jgi:hypothetical protein
LERTKRITQELRRLAFERHGSCCKCDHHFAHLETSVLGYDADGSAQYVCGTCAEGLAEVAETPAFMERPYVRPSENAYLWRYMDFAKYVSLLSTRGLHFARADTFEDRFEGAKGTLSRKAIWDKHYLDFFMEAQLSAPGAAARAMTEGQLHAQATRLLNELEAAGQHFRVRTFISCWHENDHESEAMWRLYSSYLQNAVAIRTTYSRLYAALGRDPQIPIGRVKYIDMRTSFANVNDAFWRKRISFSHENEVRALICDIECTERGKLVPCDLDQLVEAVFVSPATPNWFSALVNEVTSKYGLKVAVSASQLNEEHFI